MSKQKKNSEKSPSEKKRVAIIDLGSNTSKLVLMEYRPNHSYRQLDEIRQLVRLAEGMGKADVLRVDAAQRAMQALTTFDAYCKAVGVEDICITATSAVREATNGESFLDEVRSRTDLEPRILSDEEEAYYEAVAAANSLPFDDAYIFDIGGGSAEFSKIEKRKMVQANSYTIGALRMTEQFLTSDPPKKKEVKALVSHIQDLMGDFKSCAEEVPLIGMGGTLRNLAKIQIDRDDHSGDLVHHYVLSKDDLEDITEDLLDMEVEEIRDDVSGLKSDRADIITAGAVTALEVLNITGASSYVICDQGLREGLFYGYLLDRDPPLFESAEELRDFSVRNLERLYYDNEPHNDHVEHLALNLFDQLAELHGYGDAEKRLLSAGARLHDIGMAITYNDHEEHGLYILMNHTLPGFSQREQAIIALLVRYHRDDDSPEDEGLDDLLEDGDMERLAKLAALLRLAEYLERSKAQNVKEVKCHVGKGYVQIEALSDTDVTIEVQEANLRSELFAEAYGVEVEIVQRF